jgi:hypothetical protein
MKCLYYPSFLKYFLFIFPLTFLLFFSFSLSFYFFLLILFYPQSSDPNPGSSRALRYRPSAPPIAAAPIPGGGPASTAPRPRPPASLLFFGIPTAPLLLHFFRLCFEIPSASPPPHADVHGGWRARSPRRRGWSSGGAYVGIPSAPTRLSPSPRRRSPLHPPPIPCSRRLRGTAAGPSIWGSGGGARREPRKSVVGLRRAQNRWRAGSSNRRRSLGAGAGRHPTVPLASRAVAVRLHRRRPPPRHRPCQVRRQSPPSRAQPPGVRLAKGGEESRELRRSWFFQLRPDLPAPESRFSRRFSRGAVSGGRLAGLRPKQLPELLEKPYQTHPKISSIFF